MTGFEVGFLNKCAEAGMPVATALDLLKVANSYMGYSPTATATMGAGGGVGAQAIKSPTMPKPMAPAPKPPSAAPSIGAGLGKM